VFGRNDSKNDSIETFLGPGSSFRGDLSVKGRLRVDGTVEGNIDADWLVIGPQAVVRGDVRGREVNVAGTLEGNVEGSELVEIRPKGVLHGDIVCPKLSIHEGGTFSGRSMMAEGRKGREPA